ncbi:tRNA (adenosine(37)-N6)-threonylcarbamoyltransferase complex ATPase subunit type 1 TsaE [soil metagenome]
MIVSHTVDQTKQIAKALALELKGGELITLRGDLGSGKTTFAQGLAESLGVKVRVNSPTFLVLKEYETDTNSPVKKIVHGDLYRLQSEQERECIGLLELLKQKDNLVILEWPEKMGSLLPKKRIEVDFEYVNEEERKIIITKYE